MGLDPVACTANSSRIVGPKLQACLPAAKVSATAKPSSAAVGTSSALAPLPRTSTSGMPSVRCRSGRALRVAEKSSGGTRR
jgi:hypothetical protein